MCVSFIHIFPINSLHGLEITPWCSFVLFFKVQFNLRNKSKNNTYLAGLTNLHLIIYREVVFSCQLLWRGDILAGAWNCSIIMNEDKSVWNILLEFWLPTLVTVTEIWWDAGETFNESAFSVKILLLPGHNHQEITAKFQNFAMVKKKKTFHWKQVQMLMSCTSCATVSTEHLTSAKTVITRKIKSVGYVSDSPKHPTAAVCHKAAQTVWN